MPGSGPSDGKSIGSEQSQAKREIMWAAISKAIRVILKNPFEHHVLTPYAPEAGHEAIGLVLPARFLILSHPFFYVPIPSFWNDNIYSMPFYIKYM